MKREVYEPPGFPFYDGATGRKMMLVTGGQWKGWLAWQHPDGEWVSLRKATDQDRKVIFGAIWPTNTLFYVTRPAVENCPDPQPGWEETTCDVCGRAVWKRDIEPDEYPPNVRPACTMCSLRAGQAQSGFPTPTPSRN